MTVNVGSDTYGRVKVVGKTSVVTSFVMVQGIPIWPSKSYYCWGPNLKQQSGIPFVLSEHQVSIQGFQLQQIDRLSVVFAYLRALLAVLFFLGFVASLIAVMSAAPKNEEQILIRRFSYGTFFGSLLLGGASYLIPTENRTQREIRRYCGEELQVCIDPAKVVPEVVNHLRGILQQKINTPSGIPILRRQALIHSLILVRCESAIASTEQTDQRSDQLLSELQQLDHLEAIPSANLDKHSITERG
jgi:hypothetical protein